MKISLIGVFFYFFTITGFCEAPDVVLAQAKASSLWHPVSLNDIFIESNQLLSQDPVLANWGIEEIIIYVKIRTQELKEKSLATQRYVKAERLKGVSVKDLAFPWKTEKIYWNETFSIPTVVDFAAARRLSKDEKYKDELNKLFSAFADAYKANPKRSDEAITARLIFKSLFREKAQ